MRCEDIDFEAIADGTTAATAAELDHVATCAACQRSLALARSIESALVMQETPVPPPGFTAGVMGRIGEVRWRTEQVVDFSFNVAVALGLLVIVASGAGLAWSIGLFTITVDRATIALALDRLLDGRVLPQVQTTALAAVLLAMTLGLWWWAESDSAA
jgi:hypothetical protein